MRVMNHSLYDDPRDTNVSAGEVLTEDSDDALADLEKEYAVRRQKLLEAKARRRAAPVGGPTEDPAKQPEANQKGRAEAKGAASSPTRGVFSTSSGDRPSTGDYRSATSNPKPTIGNHKASTGGYVTTTPPQNTSSSSAYTPREVAPTRFAARLAQADESAKPEVDYTDRIFEFTNLPNMTIVPATDDTSIDQLSGEVVSRRYYSAAIIQEATKGFKVLRAAKLLAKVCAPHFDEPQYTNWCFSGIIMHKSDPRTSSKGSKYIAFRVGSFVHTVDVYLFGDAFAKYWKLRCGDVVAILNPTVKKLGKSFTLLLLDPLEAILEVGTSKHYGHCAAKTKQGEQCKFVVDKLQNLLCNYHEESKYKRGSRMELQGSVKPKAPLNSKGQTAQAYLGGSGRSTFLQYTTAGFSEKDLVYAGGEQFDQNKYDRPVKESEAAKMRKRRANDKLRSHLLRTAAPSRVDDLERMGLVTQDGADSDKRQLELRNVRLQAFNGKFLNGVGYDPTLDKTATMVKAAPLDSLQELKSLSRTKKISLEASTQDRQQKVKRAKQALKLTSGKKVVPGQWHPTATAPKQQVPGISGADAGAHEPGPAESCDESDLEISFACDADQQKYRQLAS